MLALPPVRSSRVMAGAEGAVVRDAAGAGAAVVDGGGGSARPAWRLCKWATRVSLAEAAPARSSDGAISYEDETKRVVSCGGAAGGPDLVLELRASAEHRGHARAAGEAWPHLLVEQDAACVITPDRLERLELDVYLRNLLSR